MNIQLLYADNSTGRLLADGLRDSGLRVYADQTTFMGDEYLEINVLNQQGKTRILNHRPAMKLTMNQTRAFELLQANKVYCLDPEEDNVNRAYKILVFDLDIISICVEVIGKGTKPKYIKENENMKAAQIARRVSTILGLDMVMVEIALTSKRKWKIAGLELSPELRPKDIEQVVNKLKVMYMQGDTEVKMGADPEFMLVNSRSGRMVAASEYFPREGMVGCDAIRIPNRQQRPIAEIRPRPDLEPQHLVVNIREALRNASRLAPAPNVKWVAGSQPFPGYSIGGHIHFSNIKLNAALLRALDNYLGIPVFLIEDQLTAVRRRKRYGKLSDYRTKNHGGFEYRTPGSWLVSKEIATAVLCLAKVVVSCYTELNSNYLNNVQAYQAFYRGDQDYFRRIFPHLWAEIEATELARKYAQEMSILPWMIENHVAWDEKKDLRKSWKIIDKSKKKPEQFIEAGQGEVSSVDTYLEPNVCDDGFPEPVVNPDQSRPRRRRSAPQILGTRNLRSTRSPRSTSPSSADNRIRLFSREYENDNPDFARVIGPEHIRRVSTHFEMVSAYQGATAGY